MSSTRSIDPTGICPRARHAAPPQLTRASIIGARQATAPSVVYIPEIVGFTKLARFGQRLGTILNIPPNNSRVANAQRGKTKAWGNLTTKNLKTY